MELAKYRKKPVTIEAALFDGTEDCAKEIAEWTHEEAYVDYEQLETYGTSDTVPLFVGLFIRTLEGNMHVSPGDYVIRGVQGEFYPCKPDIFEQTYEVVEEEPTYDYDWAVSLQGEAVADME